MLPSEDESQDDPIRLFYYEQDRVLRYSDISNLTIDACTIEDPGLIDISSEDSDNDIQQESITLSSGAVQLKKDSALNKKVMDREKQFKSKSRKTNPSDTNKKKNVDFKNNTGLIGMKISQRDVIVDDVPDINQNVTNKNTKNKVSDPSSVKVVPDVYERIIDLTIDACTIEDPGLIDISSEDPDNDIQQESITLSSGAVQLKKDSALNKKVMDREKQFKSKSRKTNPSDTNKKKNVDFKNNTGLIGMKISQRDVIVDDVPDINQNVTNKNTKNKVSDPSSVKVVPDVYERIIGKAYDNINTYGNQQPASTANSLSNNSNADLKTASNLSANNTSKASIQTYRKPLEEVSVYQTIDSKRPKKVCRSKSLYILPIQKTVELEKNVLLTSKTHNITEEVNFKGLYDNNLHYSKITTTELSLNQNIKTQLRDKSKSTTTHEMSTPIITQAAKIEDAKITRQCGNVNVKPLIHNRKNVDIKMYGHLSSEGSKIIKPTDTKKICKSIDDLVINQVAPKVAASILKNRRNTISSAGQITKSTNSEKVTKVKRKNGVPNYNDHITKLNLFDKITKPVTCDNDRNMIIKNDNLNCNNQFKTLKDATITDKLLNNEKAFEQTKDKINAIINTKMNSHVTMSRVDANNKPCHSEKPIHMKRKVINIIQDQVLTSFVPKVAASISNKRRNTVSSICPENTTSLKVCSKSIFSDDKIIPHYHARLHGNKTGNKDRNDKTDADTKTIPVKLTQVKSHLEVNPEKNPETITERNANKPCKDVNSTALLSQIKPSVINNKNNIVIEPTEPNIIAPPTVLPKPFLKFDPKINKNVSDTLNKDIDIPERLNSTKHFFRTIDSVSCEPVLSNMAPYPNQRSYKIFPSTFPIRSVVSNRPLQEFKTNTCFSPRTSHTALPRSHRIRPWQAPYPSNANQFNSIPNNQYPIFNRLMNSGTFAKNSYITRTVTPLPKFQHLPRPSLPLYRPNAPCLPISISNTSPKDVHQVVNKDRKETSSSKIKNPSNEAPAVKNTLNSKEINISVKNAKISEAKTVDIHPVKRSLTEIINNTKEITHTEPKSNVKDCNQAKKPPEKIYSPAILPILSFPEICDIILETSGYDYPNLKKTANNRAEWINKDTFDQSDLDNKKRKMNDESTPDKKGKISIHEYKQRLAVTTTS